ncbi:MAG: bifunctional phosphoserine phosphatase/homoserine phosphotransferase ThrH [Porticoccaceae bacterium]|nr:bifunctional phosphoserine phosphatase/homoserine phosphotransferase ThrH [Porticoccaceae bacterium]
MEIACLDLEGVLIPEIWVAFANKTGIEGFAKTTRDVQDYDALMRYRLNLLSEHNLTLSEIKEVIETLKPLEGAIEFTDWLRERFQVVILSDTFYEFAQPLMKKLGYPTLLCHTLILDKFGMISDYKLRQANHKRQAILSLKSLYFRTIAAGDSYNDISMLHEADSGVLFNAPDNVKKEFPQFQTARTYSELKKEFLNASSRSLRI